MQVHRSGAAEGSAEARQHRGEVLSRDPGVVRDRDLCTELSALVMSIIPPIVAMVCSTDIHPITAPDGYELTRGRRGSRAGAQRMTFEKRTWKLTVPSTRVHVTSGERKPRWFSSTVSP